MEDFRQSRSGAGAQAERAKLRGILGLLYAKAVHEPGHASMTAVNFENCWAVHASISKPLCGT
jgi:hypothetical protein